MPRILSNAQKKAVFVAIPASVTIDSTQINASKIYSNQEITNYPTISINFAGDGIPQIEDVVDGILYYQTIMTLHVITRNASGFNGARIAEELSNEIISEIESWTTPLTGDIRIFDPATDIKSLQNDGFEDEIYDYILSIKLYHS